MTPALVFFVTPSPRRPGHRSGLWRWLRLARRFPVYWRDRVYQRAAVLLGRSAMSHVSIGFGGAVLSPSLAGHIFFPQIPYICRCPGLRGAFVVPVSRAPAMASFEQHPPRRKSMTRIFLRWLSGGRLRSDDCVEVVAAVLRTGGVDVPRNFTAPRELFKWCVGQGYDWEPMGGPPVTLEEVGRAMAGRCINGCY